MNVFKYEGPDPHNPSKQIIVNEYYDIGVIY